MCDAGVDVIGERHGRGGVQQDGDAGGVRGAQDLQDGGEGDLELEHEEGRGGVGAEGGGGGEGGGLERVVCALGEEDTVFACGGLDEDYGDAGGCVGDGVD